MDTSGTQLHYIIHYDPHFKYTILIEPSIEEQIDGAHASEELSRQNMTNVSGRIFIYRTNEFWRNCHPLYNDC